MLSVNDGQQYMRGDSMMFTYFPVAPVTGLSVTRIRPLGGPSAGGTLGQIGNAYPSIGRVIVAIQQRKYRDNMVVGLVIASCICFTLWWLFG